MIWNDYAREQSRRRSVARMKSWIHGDYPNEKAFSWMSFSLSFKISSVHLFFQIYVMNSSTFFSTDLILNSYLFSFLPNFQTNWAGKSYCISNCRQLQRFSNRHIISDISLHLGQVILQNIHNFVLVFDFCLLSSLLHNFYTKGSALN